MPENDGRLSQVLTQNAIAALALAMRNGHPDDGSDCDHAVWLDAERAVTAALGTVSVDSSHDRCTDRAPCGPTCPRWDINHAHANWSSYPWPIESDFRSCNCTRLEAELARVTADRDRWEAAVRRAYRLLTNQGGFAGPGNDKGAREAKEVLRLALSPGARFAAEPSNTAASRLRTDA